MTKKLGKSGVEAYSIAHETKESLLKLAEKADPNIAKMKYVKAVKVIGKFTGISSAVFSWAEYNNDPTTGTSHFRQVWSDTEYFMYI